MSVAVGVDVGATKLAAARVDTRDGRMLATLRRPTEPARGGPAVLHDVRAMADELREGDPGLPAGIAICELVDPHGRVTAGIACRDVARNAGRHGAAARVRQSSGGVQPTLRGAVSLASYGALRIEIGIG